MIADFLREQGKNAIHLGGYSFGAWVSLMAIRNGFDAESFTLVSPPLDFMDFSGLSLPDAPCLIIVGDRDPFCSLASLKEWLPNHFSDDGSREVAILPGCDHFYSGFEDALAERIRLFLQRSGDAPPIS
jgi:hypothetical protein